MRRSSLLFGSDNRPTEAFAAFLHDVQVPGDGLVSVDTALQKRFFQKGPDGSPLERWELKEVEMRCPKERILQHLAACGFFAGTQPERMVYDRAAWPGALVIRAAARLQDLFDACKHGVRWLETIVFGGKRPLQPDKESFEKCCETLDIGGAELVAARMWWEDINPQTELDMMKWILRVSTLPDYFPETIFIDAPMKPPIKEGGPPVRPSTEDTIQTWLQNNPTPGSMLLSSGAPYGMAQDEAFWMLLEPHGHTVETFGHEAPADLPIENFMREVAGCVSRIRKARLGA